MGTMGGKLITLEGLDGSGKTTVWEALQDEHENAVFTSEPTETWYGDAVRRSLTTDDANAIAELFLYTADHAAHLQETIRPALGDGKTVFSDRYSDSRYAYQGATLQNIIDRPMEYVRGIHRPFTRSPDKTIYLDVDPGTALARSNRDDKFETRQHLRDVRENYEQLVRNDPGRFHRIDATRPPEQVITAVEDIVSAWLE